MIDVDPRVRVAEQPARISRRRAAVLRLGAALCIGVAFAAVATKLDDELGVFDLRADANSALTYGQRAHSHPEWSAAAGQVLETARLRMPEDATYRIVFGPEFDEARTSDFTRLFLVGFLLPRQPTDSPTAVWAFCYGCTRATLGDRFQPLAGVQGGPSFGRLRP